MQKESPTSQRKNRKFTPIEDNHLRQLVKVYGENNWEEISSQMQGRNQRQCHDRWFYYLSPKINTAPWTEEEDQLLIKTVYQLNGKWVKISKKFRGRTDTQIKNRYNTLKKVLALPDIERKKNIKEQKTLTVLPSILEEKCPHIEEIQKESPQTPDITAFMEQLFSLFDHADDGFLDNTFDFLV